MAGHSSAGMVSSVGTKGNLVPRIHHSSSSRVKHSLYYSSPVLPNRIQHPKSPRSLLILLYFLLSLFSPFSLFSLARAESSNSSSGEHIPLSSSPPPVEKWENNVTLLPETYSSTQSPKPPEFSREFLVVLQDGSLHGITADGRVRWSNPGTPSQQPERLAGVGDAQPKATRRLLPGADGKIFYRGEDGDLIVGVQ